MNAQKATIKDVAKHAGVSTATVSRVLSKSELVSEKLRTRVNASIEALHYHPSQLGRNLRRQTTNIVGFTVPDIQNPFYTSILRGIQDTLLKHNLVILIANSDVNPEQELVELQTLRAQGVIGIIFAPTKADYEDIRDRFKGVPVVAIDRIPKNLSIDTVTVNNAEGVLAAAQYLISLGHTRIGFIAGDPNVSPGHERLQGYLEALRQANFTVEDDLIQRGSFSQQGGVTAMTRLLNLSQPPSAIISSNNLMTLGALQAINECCVKIPEDIGLIGFDDVPWAASWQPSLTVIAQPTYDIGCQAAKLLLERLDEPSLPTRNIVLETELVIRASTIENPCK